MSVLAYIESSKGKVKKNAFEIVSYSSELAKKLDTDLVALVLNCNDISELSKYGASKILKVTSSELENFNAKSYANIIAQAAKISNSNHIVLSSSLDTKYLAPLLSIELDAGYLSNVVELPSSLSPFTVKRTSFTNKAFSDSTIDSEFKIIGLSSNAFGLLENNVESSVEDFNPSLIEEKITIKSTEKISGKISIADADIVVSAGRGLKGPENWNIIEELAETLGAATAC